MAATPTTGDRDALPRSLLALRRTAGLGQIDAARAAGISQTKLSRVENGLTLPKPEEVAALAAAYHAPAAERRRLAAMAGDLRAEHIDSRVVLQRGAWNFQQRIGRIEQSSARIRSFHPAIVIGLLQTRDYARAVFASGGYLAAGDIERAVEARAARSDLLADPGREWTLIHTEGALRWTAVSPALMAAQVDHIADLASRLPNVRVGVIPWNTPAEVFPLHGFHIYDSRAVQIGTETASALMSDPRDTTAYDALFRDLEALAVFDDEAAALLHRVATDYRALEERA